MSIRTRLLLSFAIITLIAVVTALSGYNGYLMSLNEYHRLADMLVPAQTNVSRMVDLARELGDEPLAYAFTQTDADRASQLAQFRQTADELIKLIQQVQAGSGAQNTDIILASAQTLIDRGQDFIRLVDQQTPNGNLQTAQNLTEAAEDSFQDLLADGAVSLQTVMGSSVIDQVKDRVVLWTAVSILGSILTGASALYVLIRFITQPIEHLKTSAGAIATGNYTGRVTVARMDEIGELAVAFNRMASAVEKRELALTEINQTLEARISQRTDQLRQAKEQAEAIFNHTSDAIILIGENHVIDRTNPAFLALFGYSEPDVPGLTIDQLVADDQRDALLNALQQAVVQRQSIQIELRCRRRDGTAMMADAAFGAIGADPYLQHILCGFHDITAQKQAQQELEETLRKERELSAMKSGFVSLVSHEFRTPLAVIQSSTDLMKRYWDRLGESRRQEKLSEIQTQIDVMISYLEDFLTVNGTEMVGAKFAPARTDVFQFSRDLIDELQEAMNSHAIILSTQGDTAEVNADPKLLRQILVNLLTNAMKYSALDAPVEVEVVGAAETVTLSVRDRGIGIPEEDQERIFNPFHRGINVGNISGTGLGLAIVKRAVEAHHGTVSFETMVGKGTTFKIVLPAASLTDRT